MARVEFDRIYKRFGKVDVVQDISFDIKDEEFMVLVGPSGCGKSTCLRMVAGLEEPSEGEIRIGERVVNGVDPKDRDIAMVFQNYALYPHMSVFDNMAFGLKLRRVPKPEIKKKVEEAAGLLGLENLLKRKPKELSGGQRQRVALGRAIVRNAQVFLMDEPLSNLDAKLRVETRANIIRLHQQISTTTIYVTHDQVEAMTMGDRIAVLNGGKIQQLGTPQDLYDHPSNMFVAGFIGTPSMNFFPKVKVVSEGDSATVVLDGIGQVKVPAVNVAKAREAAGKDKALTFGIRPVHLKSHELAGSNGASTINADIDVVENLGNELQVYFTTGGQSAIATLDPGSFVRVGDKIKLYVNSDHVHLFDTETGESYF